MHSPQVYYSLGLLYSESCNFSKAANYFKEYLIGEKDPEGYFWLGKSLSELKQYKESINAISKSISLDTKNAKYYLYRGKIYDEQGLISEARVDYMTALSLDSKCLVPYFIRYKEFLKNGNKEKAHKIKRFLMKIKQVNS